MNINLEGYTDKELISLKEKIQEKLNNKIADEINITNVVNDQGRLICPICSGTNTIRDGKTKQGVQKVRCNDCKKSPVISKGRIMHSSKKSFNQWAKFIESTLIQDKIEISALKAEISIRTAFRWRIKVLSILANLMNNVELEGTAFLDDTLIKEVEKNRNIPKSSTPKKKGVSNDKISIACAIDLNGNTVIKIADIGRITTKALNNAFKGRIKERSIVVADSHCSHNSFMKELNLIWERIPSKKKSNGKYDLSLIDQLHSRIHYFLYNYKGVSLKYLQGYLALFDLLSKNPKFFLEDIKNGIITTICTISGHVRCVDIDEGRHIIV